jgi:exopolyphosphatase/pppGpp-phosphohydrolase
MTDPQFSEQAAGAVHQLAFTCLEDLGHTNQVTRLALMLFDELGDLHHLAETDRIWLEYGAMLHDIGWVNGQKGHHKQSLAMILESKILPFNHKEKLIIGSIARYHRKSLPAMDHDHYAELKQSDREMVSRLAALLRNADGLDYTHTNLISRIHAEIRPGKVHLFCQVSHSARIEFAQAQKKSDLFELVFRKTPIFIEELD